MLYAYLFVLGALHLVALVMPLIFNDKQNEKLHIATEILIVFTYFVFGYYSVFIAGRGDGFQFIDFYALPPRVDTWV